MPPIFSQQEPRRLWRGIRHDMQFFDELKAMENGTIETDALPIVFPSFLNKSCAFSHSFFEKTPWLPPNHWIFLYNNGNF